MRLCFHLCLFVCLSARLLKKLRTNFEEFLKGGVAQGRFSYILVAIRITIRIQEFFEIYIHII